MAFLKFNLFKQKEPLYLKEKNEKESIVTAVAKYISVRYEKYYQRENFEYPDESLYEIKRAIATDSYISEAHNKYKEKIFKAGYYYKGSENIITYIKNRFSIMNYMNETLIDVMFQEIADDLIDYSNAYLLKLRVSEIPFFEHLSRKDDKNFIGGYMRVDPCHVVVVKDKYNNIIRYEIERMGYENQKVDKDDLIHFYLNRKAEAKVGTPRLQPVLEDIKALRDIEGDVLTLIHRFCFPLYHVKVGLAQSGYNGTQTDIDDIQEKIENMSEDGILITNEKVEINIVGTQGNALDVLPYLDYFENRVFAGLNTSQSQMGRNGEKTPDSVEAQIHDTVKHIEKVFSIFIKHHIFNELLLEGGFNPVLNTDDQIDLVFNEISLDTRVKLENHEALKYESNIQTLSETRTGIGMEQSVDENDLFVNNVTLYSAGIQTEQKTEGAIELAKVQAALAPTPVNSSPNTSKTKTPDKDNKKNTTSKAVRSNNRPQNQHGVYSVKIKESLDNIEKEEKLSKDCYKTYHTLGNNSNDNENKRDSILANMLEIISLQKNQAEIFYGKKLEADTSELEALYCKEAEAFIDNLLNDVDSKEDLDKKFYRLPFTISYWSKKYYWHCLALLAKSDQKRLLDVIFSSEKEAANRKSKIELNLVTTSQVCKDLPPYHPGCQCSLDIGKGILKNLKRKEDTK